MRSGKPAARATLKKVKTMDPEREHLLHNLAAMAAAVVEARQTGLALDWLLWSWETGEPLPRVSRGLPRVLQNVSDHRYTQSEARL
jgi:hypothetical protein